MSGIIRQWSGWAKPEKANEYPALSSANVVPEVMNIRGFVGADLSRCSDGDLVKFTVISRWESMEAIKGFAGYDPSQAVVEPEAVAALEKFDATVSHSEILRTVRSKDM